MASDARERALTASGEPTYWLLATNRDTEHWVCWPERASLSAAVDDARRVAREVDLPEFRQLLGDDQITFLVAEHDPRRLEGEEFVWSWIWGEPMPPG
jgi:hypothetical protein